jgi:hypothetical protein
MKIWEDFFGSTWFEGAAAPAPLREAYGYGGTIDPDEDQWRRLTGDAQRDLTPMTQSRMQKIAHFLWESNLLGNRIIELPVAYILAEGVALTVKDPENQKVLDRFWRDPINDMDLKLPKKVRELGVFGEQCYPAFVNEIDGHVRLGYLDPALIETVVTDPDNREQPIGIVTTKDRKGTARRYKVIINGPEEVFAKRTRAIRESFPDGEAFYFRINDLSSGTRGRSDLLAQADWLDAYDQFLFGELERAGALRAFMWDVTLKNATADQVKARAKEITAPKSGSVRVHNDSEEWSAEAPDLKSVDTAQGARLFRNHVLGGATLPEHWFGGGGDVNRATGESMGEPTFKVLSMRQRFVKHMLESIGRYVLMQASDSAEIDWSDEKFAVEAVMPELTSTDTTKYASALQQIVVACAVAIEKGLLTELTAVKIVNAIAGRLGVEFDADAELKAAREEMTKREATRAERDSFTEPDGAAGAGALMQEARDILEEMEQRRTAALEEMRRLVESARPAGNAPAGSVELKVNDGVERLVEAQAAGMRELGERFADLLARLARPRSRTITLPDGRKFELNEEDRP